MDNYPKPLKGDELIKRNTAMSLACMFTKLNGRGLSGSEYEETFRLLTNQHALKTEDNINLARRVTEFYDSRLKKESSIIIKAAEKSKIARLENMFGFNYVRK